MQQKMIFAGVATLVLAGAVASPSYAWVHHHRLHHGLGHQSTQSTPAERQQTAELNRQQLAQAQANGASGSSGTTASMSTGTATQQNGLATEPTSFQRSGTGAGTVNPPSSSIGSEPAQAPANSPMPGAPAQNNPGDATPPPANPSGGTQ